MDMGNLDDISMLLGKLSADADASQKSRALLHSKVDQMAQELAVLSSQSVKLAADIGKIATELKAVDNRVQHLEHFKVRALAFVTILSAVGAFVGNNFSKLAALV